MQRHPSTDPQPSRSELDAVRSSISRLLARPRRDRALRGTIPSAIAVLSLFWLAGSLATILAQGSPGSWRHHTCGDCVSTLALTDDAVWAGTVSAGLIRHDRTTGDRVQMTVEDGLPGRAILDIDVGPGGDLWIVTRSSYVLGAWSGLGHWDGGSWQHHGLDEGLPSLQIHEVLALDGGRAMLRSVAGVVYHDGRDWQIQGTAQGLSAATVNKLARSPSGETFAATSDGLYRHDGSGWSQVEIGNLPGSDLGWLGFGPAGELWVEGGDFLGYSPDPSTPGGEIWTRHPAPPRHAESRSGPVMAGVDESGQPWALQRLDAPSPDLGGLAQIYDGASWTERNLNQEIGLPVGALALGIGYNGRPSLAFDAQGGLWASQARVGLFHHDGQGWQPKPSDIGPASVIAFSVKPAQGGGVWLGLIPMAHPDRLLGHFDGRGWHQVGEADGLPTGGILGVTQSRLDVDPSGRVWLASDGANGDDGWLAWSDGDTWSSATVEELFGGENLIHCVTADGQGGVWLGAGGASVHYHPDQGVLARYEEADGLPGASIRAIAVDRRRGVDRVWFGSETGVAFLESGTFTHYREVDGLGADQTSAILVDDRRDAVWFASQPGLGPTKISRLDDSGWTIYDESDGLAGDGVWDMALAPDGRIWAAVGNDDDSDLAGLGRFDGERWAMIRETEGLLSNIVFDVTVDPRGVVWAATIAGLSELDPVAAIPVTPTASTRPPTVTPEAGCVCRAARERAPAALISAILSDPDQLGGHGQPRDPNKPPGPFNPPRLCLGIHNAGTTYHPLFNPLEWKAGCP